MLFDRPDPNAQVPDQGTSYPREPGSLGSRSKGTSMLGVLILAAPTVLSSCAGARVRSVVDVVPEQISYELEAEVVQRSSARNIPDEDRPAERPLSGIELQEALRAMLASDVELDEAGGEPRDHLAGKLGMQEPASAFDGMGSGARQLDPDLGPMDLGYPLLVDFGAGEAPYDDGVATIHGVELTRSGFSDSVLQAAWREQWSTHSMLHLTVAFTRYQDLGIMDGIEDTRFAWCVVGWKASH
ncbi:MAG: hypothetical protein AAGG01_22875 [Planctomycetota bacterium]